MTLFLLGQKDELPTTSLPRWTSRPSDDDVPVAIPFAAIWTLPWRDASPGMLDEVSARSKEILVYTYTWMVDSYGKSILYSKYTHARDSNKIYKKNIFLGHELRYLSIEAWEFFGLRE